MRLESELWSKAQPDRKVQRKEQSFFPHLPQQTQIPDYAELIVKFLDALIDTYLPGIDEETSEESLLTPTSPYPPAVQSQLSITANLNLSNSMTSLATSQHSPGQCLFWCHLGGGNVGISWFRSLTGSLDVYVSNIGHCGVKSILNCSELLPCWCRSWILSSTKTVSQVTPCEGKRTKHQNSSTLMWNMCPAEDPWLTGTGMVCSGCRGVRQGCWNDLGTDLAVSVEGHSGQHLPVWNTASVAAPAVCFQG